MANTVDRERLVETFIELAKIPSPSDHEERVSSFIQDYLQALGIESSADDAGNLLVFVPGALPADPIMLCGHMDTVDRDPQTPVPVIRDGDTIRTDGTRILGADNKDNLAAILEATRVVVASDTPHRPFELVFTTGEEKISKGAKRFDCSRLASRRGIISDGPRPYGVVTVSAPGHYDFRGVIHGLTSHSAYSNKGINALTYFMRFMQELAQRGIRLGFQDAEGSEALNFNVVHAGHVFPPVTPYAEILDGSWNSVPELVEFRGELRGKDREALVAKVALIQAAFAAATDELRAAYDALKTERVLPASSLVATCNADPYLIEENGSFVQAVMSVLRDQGVTPEVHHALGGSDANVFSAYLGHPVETVLISGPSIDNHQPDEATDIPELVRLAEFYTTVLTSNI